MEKNSEIKVKQCEREKTEIRKSKNGIDQQRRQGKKIEDEDNIVRKL